MQRVSVLDSHTEGEPTRIVMAGGPDLGDGPLAERRERFRREFDVFRSAVVNEPRGADHIVGALLCAPHDSSCAAGVIFFNNTGYLGMCGHGTIGLMATLAHTGAIAPGEHRIETPVGIVTAQWHGGGRASVTNVVSYRLMKGVPVEVEGIGTLTGDVAWGGNWFFLCNDHGQEISMRRLDELTDCARRIKRALAKANLTGKDGAEIDHIELFGPPQRADANSRSFVLCPGDAYDRSPCGTGTSAKLACLVADGKFDEDQVWRQESVLGTLFEGSVRVVDGEIVPTITGSAFVTGETTLLFDPADPLREGVRF